MINQDRWDAKSDRLSPDAQIRDNQYSWGRGSQLACNGVHPGVLTPPNEASRNSSASPRETTGQERTCSEPICIVVTEDVDWFGSRGPVEGLGEGSPMLLKPGLHVRPS